MRNQPKNFQRDLLILREHLKGRTYASIADGLGLSHSRPKQIVDKLFRTLRRFLQEEGIEVDNELNNARYLNPLEHVEFWQGVQARYEAKRTVCTINAEVPKAKPPPRSPEEILQAERDKLAKRIGWLRRRLNGETFKQIAEAEGVKYPAVYQGALQVLERLPYRTSMWNDPSWWLDQYPKRITSLLAKFEQQHFPNPSPQETPVAQ